MVITLLLGRGRKYGNGKGKAKVNFTLEQATKAQRAADV